MESTIPPNTAGFSRKPKNRKRVNWRKSTIRTSGFNPFACMPEKEQSLLIGSMFLIAAAKILGPAIGFDALATQSANTAND